MILWTYQLWDRTLNFTSPIEDIGDVTNVTQQETRRSDNQQDRLVTVLRTKISECGKRN